MMLDSFTDEQDLTAADLNEILRRLRELETLLEPARVIESEHTQAQIRDYAKQGVYLFIRAVPWFLVGGVVAARVIAGVTDAHVVDPSCPWGMWSIATAVGALLLFLSLRTQYLAGPPRWVLRHRFGDRVLLLSHTAGFSNEVPVSEAEARESWLGRVFGLRWIDHPTFRADVPCLKGPPGLRVIPDLRRSATEVIELAATLAGLSIALARTLLSRIAHVLGPDKSFLVLLAVIMLIILLAGRAIVVIVTKSVASGGA